MASKATYGLMEGLGQGVSQWGGAMMTDALRERADERTTARQRSLEEIRQRYQNQRIDDDRQYEIDKITPGSPIYDRYEGHRQKVRGEEQEDTIEQINARGEAYGYGQNRAPSSVQGYEYYANLTPEQQAIYDHVNKIRANPEGLSQEDAQNYILDMWGNFNKMDAFEREDTLKSLGLDPSLQGEALRSALFDVFRADIKAVAGSQPLGLMDQVNAGGQIGSSADNPIRADQLSGPPMNGWVLMPSGQVVEFRNGRPVE